MLPELSPEDRLQKASQILDELQITGETKSQLLQHQLKISLNTTHKDHEKKFALQILPDIQEHMKDVDSCVLFYPYAEYKRWAKHTLLLYVRRAVQYIVDNLDDEDKSFAKWRDKVEIGRDHQLGGVYIRPIPIIPIIKARKLSLEQFENSRTDFHDKPKGRPTDNFEQVKAKLFVWMQSAKVKDEFTPAKSFVLTEEQNEELVKVFDKSDDFAYIRKPGESGFKVIKIC